MTVNPSDSSSPEGVATAVVVEGTATGTPGWTYRHPSPLARRIKNHVAFSPIATHELYGNIKWIFVFSFGAMLVGNLWILRGKRRALSDSSSV